MGYGKHNPTGAAKTGTAPVYPRTITFSGPKSALKSIKRPSIKKQGKKLGRL